MSKKATYTPGQVIEVKNYPFVSFVFHGTDIDGPFSDDGWRPGCNTATIGTQLSFSFTGTGFDLRLYCNNQGGAWQISVDGVNRGGVAPANI